MFTRLGISLCLLSAVDAGVRGYNFLWRPGHCLFCGLRVSVETPSSTGSAACRSLAVISSSCTRVLFMRQRAWVQGTSEVLWLGLGLLMSLCPSQALLSSVPLLRERRRLNMAGLGHFSSPGLVNLGSLGSSKIVSFEDRP